MREGRGGQEKGEWQEEFREGETEVVRYKAVKNYYCRTGKEREQGKESRYIEKKNV